MGLSQQHSSIATIQPQQHYYWQDNDHVDK